MGRNVKNSKKKRCEKGGVKKYMKDKTLLETVVRGRQDSTNVSAGARMFNKQKDLQELKLKEIADKKEMQAAKQAAMVRARAKRAAEEAKAAEAAQPNATAEVE